MAFRYSVRVTLDRSTGIQTAVLAINEVAAREFVGNAEASGDVRSYVDILISFPARGP
jgi:hypothetical protein